MTSPYTSQKPFSYAQAPYRLPTPKPPKPPIHNPYDKFTQPEFDSWIGGITGALKRALGQESEIEQEPKAHEPYFTPVSGGNEAELPDDSESIDEAVDDSFAEIKARRALGKGKARDPREGPGFGTGDVHQPIEIDSDSEEQEVEESEEEEEEEEWDGEEENSGEEEQAWNTGESSAQAQIRHGRRDVDSVDEYEDEVQSDQEYSGEDGPETRRDEEEEVILLSSDEDERGDAAEYDEDELEHDEAPAETRGIRSHHVEDVDDEDVYELDPEAQDAEYISDAEDDAEDENAQILEQQGEENFAPPPPRVSRAAPHSFEVLEDEEDRLDESARYPVDRIDDGKVTEHISISADFNGLIEAATSSPNARTTHIKSDSAPHELRRAPTPDLKSTRPATVQPEIYEIDNDEDDIAENQIQEEGKKVFTSEPAPSPHYAATNKQPPVYDVDMDEEVDELEAPVTQPMTEDTSFPQHEISPTSMDVEVPVEIPDVWAGPKIYAEDYYSGGDVRPDPDIEISAHHLGIGDQEVNVSTSEPTVTVAKAKPNDVIVVASPKGSPGARLDQLLESSKEVVQPREEAQIIEEVDKIMSSPLHPPIQEIFESQDSQLAQELSFDDLYDIDMASFDTSTFSVDPTGASWDFSSAPGEEMISAPDGLLPFQGSTAPTFMETDIKPVGPTEDYHVQDSYPAVEEVEIELRKSVEIEKPVEVQEPPAVHELAEVQGLVDLKEPVEVQELTVEEEESVVAPQLTEPQTLAEVIELVKMQDPAEMHIRDDEIERIREQLQPQNIEPDVEITVISEPEQVWDQRDMFFEVWDEPPSIRIEPPSPIPPITPTTEQQQPLENQAEDLPTQLESPQPMTGQDDSDNVTMPTAEAKSGITPPNSHDVENGLPTPPSEPIYETIDVDALSEDVEHPPPSTSNTTPEYEIIVGEDADEADLTIGEASVAPEDSHKANTNPDNALEAPEELDNTTIMSDITHDLITSHTDDAALPSVISPDVPSSHASSHPSPHLPVSAESLSHDPKPPEIEDLSRGEEQVTTFQRAPQLPHIESTSSPTSGSIPMPVCADSSIPDPTSRPRTPMVESPPVSNAPGGLNTMPSLFGPSLPPSPSPAYFPMRVIMRKSTNPVLFSDPYPYSLSTPGDFVETPRYMVYSEEETEQENSLSSSSTFDNHAEDKEKEKHSNEDGLGHGAEPDSFEMDLRYPSDNDQSPVIPTNPPSGKVPETADFHNDRDADGDLDLDFGGANESVYMSLPQPPSIPVHSKDDPFTAVNSTHPDIRKNGEDHAVIQRKSDSTTKPVTSPPTNGVRSTASNMSVDGLPSILIVKPKPAPRVQIPHEEDLEELTELEDSSPNAPKSARLPKRKLSASFLQGFSPITRSMATKKPELSGSSMVKSAMKRISSKTNKSASSLVKGKGKQRSDRQQSEQPSESSKSSGSASKISRRDTNASRESSIASSAPSDKSSTANQPSPTLNKPTTSRPSVPPPPPLMHTHSHAFRHVHHPPSTPQQPRVQPQVRKASSLGNPAGESSTAKPAPPSQHPARGPSFFASSPVTRSNCRYHKISIPREEDDPDGPRVYFIIPGCSLGDKKLIDEEFILDHGDATHEDSLRMVQDMEGWGVHPYIIGVLRVLAGVDTTREQDFYYLPHPSEVRPEPKASLEKPTSVKHPSRSHHENGATHGSPRTPVVSNPSPISSKAPISTASNSTTSTKGSQGGTKRSLKRSRTSDVHGGEDAVDRGPKKLKARQTEWWRDD